MLRRITRAVVVAAVLSMIIGTAIAKGPPSGKRGNSHVWQFSLVAQDGTNAWGNATAKIFDDGTVEVVVNGKNIVPGVEYVVKTQGEVVGYGYANPGGNVNISGSVQVAPGSVGYINLREAVGNASVLKSDDSYSVPSDE